MSQPNFYAVIPATVRYCEDLIPTAKLLYGEITALSNERGYCWASNSYFAKLYNVSDFTVSRWISQLEKKGFIRTQIDKDAGNQRIIYISDLVPLLTKNARPLAEKRKTLLTKSARPLAEKRKHNNTVNTTLSNTVSNAHDENSLGFKNEKKAPPPIAPPPPAPIFEQVPILFSESEWANIAPDLWRVALIKYAPETAGADLDYYWLRCRDWSAQGGNRSANWLATAAGFVAGDKRSSQLRKKIPTQDGQQPIINRDRIRERAGRIAQRLGFQNGS
jgi:DNA-binding MarR family transcriptional regulator